MPQGLQRKSYKVTASILSFINIYKKYPYPLFVTFHKVGGRDIDDLGIRLPLLKHTEGRNASNGRNYF